jgi:hypothetical protein
VAAKSRIKPECGSHIGLEGEFERGR